MNRIGETRLNKHGTLMKAIVYNSCLDVVVEFQDEHKAKVHTTYTSFNKGQVKNPYDKTVYDIGCLGLGSYQTNIDCKKAKAYKTWHDMIGRCYEEGRSGIYEAYYEICTVCEEWKCYQTFAKWYEENQYECKGRLHLDKDILYPGNKIYSPDTCLLVPQRINMVFTNKTNNRGLPNGIVQQGNGYLAKYNHIELGVCDTVEEAYEIYAKEKEKHIKQIADEYREIIPAYIYEALCRYKVDIKNDKNYIAA